MTTDQKGVYSRSRSEHLEWCKNRAYRYLKEGNLTEAVTSMGSDLDKHEGTRANAYILMLGAMYAADGKTEDVRRWIEGFR